MKLSQRLLATHKGFWFKYLWKKKIQSKVIPVKLPDALTKSEVKPVNSVQEFFASPQANVSEVDLTQIMESFKLCLYVHLFTIVSHALKIIE